METPSFSMASCREAGSSVADREFTFFGLRGCQAASDAPWAQMFLGNVGIVALYAAMAFRSGAAPIILITRFML